MRSRICGWNSHPGLLVVQANTRSFDFVKGLASESLYCAQDDSDCWIMNRSASRAPDHLEVLLKACDFRNGRIFFRIAILITRKFCPLGRGE